GTTPTPRLDDLDALLESARTGGVTVGSEISGTQRPLPEGVDLSAYRVLQEALSNAVRHAPGSTVQVRLHFGGSALLIEVPHSCGAATAGVLTPADDVLSGGGGHGIIGMRERATMLGGHLSAGPTRDDEFLVIAALPLECDDDEASPPADDTHLE